MSGVSVLSVQHISNMLNGLICLQELWLIEYATCSACSRRGNGLGSCLDSRNIAQKLDRNMQDFYKTH